MNEQDWKCRTKLLLKDDGVDKLQRAHVLVVGVGGVGAYAAEQLVRSGIGQITIVDSDIVQPSNKNRQIIALESTIGKAKVDVASMRLLDINPNLKINTYNQFVESTNIHEIFQQNFDYVIDAIDSLTPKVDLLEACVKKNVPVVSSMGSGARIDPSLIEIVPMENSHHCKLAYMVRKYLHRRGVYNGITVVFSPEQVPAHAMVATNGANNKKTIVGTISYMPAIFGCNCASVVIRDLLKNE